MTPPPPLRLDDARQRIRSERARTGRRTVVLDDDPTGSQSVHGVEVVLDLAPEQLRRALEGPGSCCFALTNSRSLPPVDASRLTGSVTRAALDVVASLAVSSGTPPAVDLVSRSDSTLRGHVVEEVEAMAAALREHTGRGPDGVLFVPAFPEAGRFTSGDVHHAVLDGVPVPIAETEFARDATFGFRTSNLRELLAERSGGRVPAETVRSISLEDIRAGGPDRVATLLGEVTGGDWVVVNAVDHADLEVVVLGLLEAQRAGRTFLHRTGPSFVRALTGIEPRPPLTPDDVWPHGRPAGHGLVVVGSHVGLTSAQVEHLTGGRDVERVELSVAAVTDRRRHREHVEEVGRNVARALRQRDVVLVTSRTLVRAEDGEASLAIARAVSEALTQVVRAAVAARPAWVVAKGGITSHDVAVHGLGIRRAAVVGQFLPGMVGLLRPLDADPGAVGTPYVVFAGNVGDERTLHDVVQVVAGDSAGDGAGTSTGGGA
ncbi:MAG: four-carbon acid sugar kinase family protein [Actinomycetes bacterium]